MHKGRIGLIVVLVLIIGVVGIVGSVNALADETGVAVPIPGTGCTLYANVHFDTQESPPATAEGDVTCGTPPPEPTPTSIADILK